MESFNNRKKVTLKSTFQGQSPKEGESQYRKLKQLVQSPQQREFNKQKMWQEVEEVLSLKLLSLTTENIEDDSFPIDHEQTRQIDPPLQFQTKMNNKQKMHRSRLLIQNQSLLSNIQSGSQTERSQNKQALMFQEFLSFNQGILKRNITNVKANKGVKSNRTSKLQSTTALSSSLNSSIKKLQVSQHGANMFYCKKKEGDVEDNSSCEKLKFNRIPRISQYNSFQVSQQGKQLKMHERKERKVLLKKEMQNSILFDQRIAKCLIEYLNMTDTIVFQNLNKKKIRKVYNKYITKQQRYLIINTGLTRFERIRLWQNKTQLIQAKKSKEQNMYKRLAKQQSKHYQVIQTDAERTFPHMLLFNNKDRGQEMLIRILNAIANHIPELGYVQGLNFIAATLLLILCKEEDTFYVLVQLLENYKLKDIYLDNFNQLKLMCFQLESFMQAYLPQLHQIISSQNIEAEYFATRWFLTLFTYDLSIEVISTVIDLFMIEGFKCLIKISLATLNYIHQKFQEGVIPTPQSPEAFIDLVKNFNEILMPESHHLITQACNYKVTTKLMKDVEAIYLKEQRQLRKVNKQRKCRSSSLRNRMLIIDVNQQNKLEWIVLPQLPSQVNGYEDVYEKVKLDDLQEISETKEVDQSEITSLFSECEEVQDADEIGINFLKSNKKPYASRQVLSNKKDEQESINAYNDCLDTYILSYGNDLNLTDKKKLKHKQRKLKHAIQQNERPKTQVKLQSSLIHKESKVQLEGSLKNKTVNVQKYGIKNKAHQTNKQGLQTHITNQTHRMNQYMSIRDPNENHLKVSLRIKQRNSLGYIERRDKSNHTSIKQGQLQKKKCSESQESNQTNQFHGQSTLGKTLLANQELKVRQRNNPQFNNDSNNKMFKMNKKTTQGQKNNEYETQQELPFQIKNIDTGEVTYEDPFLKETLA